MSMREDKQKKKVCDLNYSFLTVLHAYDIIFVLLHILVNEFDQLTSIFFSLRWLYNDWNSAQFLTIQAQGLKKDMFISCGRVVSDFESEAKTRCNFQFR